MRDARRCLVISAHQGLRNTVFRFQVGIAAQYRARRGSTLIVCRVYPPPRAQGDVHTRIAQAPGAVLAWAVKSGETTVQSLSLYIVFTCKPHGHVTRHQNPILVPAGQHLLGSRRSAPTPAAPGGRPPPHKHTCLALLVYSGCGQPLARAHCNTRRWPPLAACAHVLLHQSQPSTRAHCSTSR